MTRSLARSLVASLILFPSLAAAQSGSGANAGYRSGAALGNPLATSGGFPSFEHPAAADSSFPASANALPSLGLPSGAPLLPAQADAIDRMRGTPPLEAPLDPESYRVDKGDVLTARFWGEQNFELSLPVDPDGRLFVPRLGYVQAHGRTLAAVAGEVHKLLQSRFPRLHLAVTLSQPRTFLVRVTGAVGSPGAAVAANGWTRASDAIRRAGGVLPGGSSRAIELHRADGTSQTVDLLLYPLFGDRSRDPALLDGDALHVPLATRAVTITGGVNRPGTYELADGSFAELLRLAGGFTPEANDRVGLRVASVEGDERKLRVVPFERDRPESIALALRHHDSVTVPTLDDGARVVVKGALATIDLASSRPDPRVPDPNAAPSREATVALPWVDGETVRGAILKAGGLAPWADLGNAWIEHSGGADAEPESPPSQPQPAQASAPAPQANPDGAKVKLVALERGGDASQGSRATAPAAETPPPPAPPEKSAQRAKDKPKKTEREAIDLRALFLRNDRGRDVRLRPGDTIHVPSSRSDVVVSGYVMRPGVYGYSLSLTPADYIALAGGATREGARGSARVVSADGTSRPASSDRPLQPGDSITVPGKTLTAAEWATICLGAVSVGLSAALLGFTIAHY